MCKWWGSVSTATAVEERRSALRDRSKVLKWSLVSLLVPQPRIPKEDSPNLTTFFGTFPGSSRNPPLLILPWILEMRLE